MRKELQSHSVPGFRRTYVALLTRTKRASARSVLARRKLFVVFFLVQTGADGYRAIRIDCALALFHVLDDSVLIYYERGAISELLIFVQDAVILGDLAAHVAQERVAEPELLREFAVRGWTIDADAEYLGLFGIDLAAGDTILVRL